jgi:beta-1,4-mannosyl-glycoprotein beta-1,4-N-acetylglucosaminyltransferase
MTTWDAVWLNDEIDLLAWRVALLRDVVDHVLVVEGSTTFTGVPKPSTFRMHQGRLASLGADIRHVVVDLDRDAAGAWDRENQQRRGMVEALRAQAQEGDLVVACDVDEVPRPEVVRQLARSLDRPIRLHMTHANYFGNWVQKEPWRNSAWAFRLGQEHAHQMLRVHFGEPHSDWEGYIEDYVRDAGWHLSFLGGEEAVRRKWAAYSHQENNNEIDRFPGHLERCFRYGVHFDGRVLLSKLPHVEPALGTLEQVRSDFFRWEKSPSLVAARVVRGWTWLRRKGLVPPRARSAVDSSDRMLFLLAPVLLLLDTIVTAQRRMRPGRPWPEQREWAPPST